MFNLIKLGSRHRGAIVAHLSGLSAEDRYDRFIGVANADYVQRYVHGVGFARDILLGAVYEHRLVGLVHLAVDLDNGEPVAEVGLSVDRDKRRLGLGRLLLQSALVEAKRMGMVRVDMMFRGCNAALSALSARVGGRVGARGRETVAMFDTNPPLGMPLQMVRTALGDECMQATHPQARGRALLVHGAGGDSYQWLEKVMPALWAQGYSVTAPTLPGHGRHAQPLHAKLAALDDCVAHAADKLAPTLVVGHSMGGYLVQRWLRTRTTLSAVLLASLPPRLPRGQTQDDVLAKLECPLAQSAARTALATAPDLDDAAIATPVRVIGGRRDRIMRKAWVHETAARYKVAAQFVSGGHRLMHGPAAAEVVRLLAS
jgi:pimeloyl-ACP methyl ester carboxylesterase